MRAEKALASLRIGADSPESSLFENAIGTKISCAGSYHYLIFLNLFFISLNIFVLNGVIKWIVVSN